MVHTIDPLPQSGKITWEVTFSNINHKYQFCHSVGVIDSRNRNVSRQWSNARCFAAKDRHNIFGLSNAPCGK